MSHFHRSQPQRRIRAAQPLSPEMAALVRERTSAKGIGQWFSRAAFTDLQGVDIDARTIPATVTTEAPVVVWDRQRSRVIQEVLVAKGGQLFDWVPMLDSHMSYSLTSNLGSVLSSRLVGNEVKSLLKFADVPDVEPVWARVRDGHLRAVSIGGRRLAFTDIEPGQSVELVGRRWTAGRLPLRVTTKWIQREVSIVIFGADGGAATDVND